MIVLFKSLHGKDAHSGTTSLLYRQWPSDSCSYSAIQFMSTTFKMPVREWRSAPQQQDRGASRSTCCIKACWAPGWALLRQKQLVHA